MFQIIYSSAATVDFPAADLRALLAVARQNNRSLDVTGMLVYQAGSFLQVLEGDRDTVLGLFEKIEKDPRHNDVRILLRAEIAAREFADWNMGFYDASGNPPAGLVDFFRTGQTVDDEGGRARRTLAQFREGAWRHRVNISP